MVQRSRQQVQCAWAFVFFCASHRPPARPCAAAWWCLLCGSWADSYLQWCSSSPPPYTLSPDRDVTCLTQTCCEIPRGVDNPLCLRDLQFTLMWLLVLLCVHNLQIGLTLQPYKLKQSCLHVAIFKWILKKKTEVHPTNFINKYLSWKQLLNVLCVSG